MDSPHQNKYEGNNQKLLTLRNEPLHETPHLDNVKFVPPAFMYRFPPFPSRECGFSAIHGNSGEKQPNLAMSSYLHCLFEKFSES